MIEVGRVCMKIAGRDAGKRCVIVDILDAHRVLIAGETRKRPCNMAHLEPMDNVVALKKGASSADIVAACKNAGITLRETKPKQAASRQKKHVPPAKTVAPTTKKPAKSAPKKQANTKK